MANKGGYRTSDGSKTSDGYQTSGRPFETFKQDLKRWVIPGQIADDAALTPRTVLRLFWQHMPVRATALFRLACWFKQRHIPLMPGLIQRWIYRSHGLEIPSGADIGGGLYIPHPNGTVIMPRRIGRNCSIIACVTIGMRNEWAFPDIGDEVFVGAGARILGGIQIGDHAVIGANSVVIHDVPAGETVVGIPARPLKKRIDVIAKNEAIPVVIARNETTPAVIARNEAIPADKGHPRE